MIEIDRQILTNGSFVKCQVGDLSTADMDYFIPENVIGNDGWCRLTNLQVVVHALLPPSGSHYSAETTAGHSCSTGLVWTLLQWLRNLRDLSEFRLLASKAPLSKK